MRIPEIGVDFKMDSVGTLVQTEALGRPIDYRSLLFRVDSILPWVARISQVQANQGNIQISLLFTINVARSLDTTHTHLLHLAFITARLDLECHVRTT